MNAHITRVDPDARKQLVSVLRGILRDELTGWQIHNLCDPIPCADVAISSITMMLECLYAGWEEKVATLDPETQAAVERCASFLATDFAIAVPSDKFLTRRRFWLRRFDTEGFMRQVYDGIWPFSSEDQKKSAQPSGAANAAPPHR